MDSNHRRRKPAELQSAPFGHSGNCPSLFFAVQRYKLFLNCANGSAHLQRSLCSFRPLITQSTACTLLCLRHRFGRQDAEDDGDEVPRFIALSIESTETCGHPLADIVEVRSISTHDTADSDDSIHPHIDEACRGIDQLKGARHTEDGHLCSLLRLEDAESSLKEGRGDIIIPFGHGYSHAKSLGRGYFAVARSLYMIYCRHSLVEGLGGTTCPELAHEGDQPLRFQLRERYSTLS